MHHDLFSYTKVMQPRKVINFFHMANIYHPQKKFGAVHPGVVHPGVGVCLGWGSASGGRSASGEGGSAYRGGPHLVGGVCLQGRSASRRGSAYRGVYIGEGLPMEVCIQRGGESAYRGVCM